MSRLWCFTPQGEKSLLGGVEIPLTYSCSAIHSFVLPSDLATISPSDIHTISFADPVLDFAEVYGQPDHLLVSLDTAWCVKGNQLPQHPGKKITVDASTISVDKMNASLAEMVIAKSGQVLILLLRIATRADAYRPPSKGTALCCPRCIPHWDDQ